mmetsp:Transcript_27572/g.58898  ORF Transcript_27572/g.58898 Transcript_27572/m.58898 type:complete len:270 (-) Transcript_27572:2256-3065(-)
MRHSSPRRGVLLLLRQSSMIILETQKCRNHSLLRPFYIRQAMFGTHDQRWRQRLDPYLIAHHNAIIALRISIGMLGCQCRRRLLSPWQKGQAIQPLAPPDHTRVLRVRRHIEQGIRGRVGHQATAYGIARQSFAHHHRSFFCADFYQCVARCGFNDANVRSSRGGGRYVAIARRRRVIRRAAIVIQHKTIHIRWIGRGDHLRQIPRLQRALLLRTIVSFVAASRSTGHGAPPLPLLVHCHAKTNPRQCIQRTLNISPRTSCFALVRHGI